MGHGPVARRTLDTHLLPHRVTPAHGRRHWRWRRMGVSDTDVQRTTRARRARRPPDLPHPDPPKRRPPAERRDDHRQLDRGRRQLLELKRSPGDSRSERMPACGHLHAPVSGARRTAKCCLTWCGPRQEWLRGGPERRADDCGYKRRAFSTCLHLHTYQRLACGHGDLRDVPVHRNTPQHAIRLHPELSVRHVSQLSIHPHVS